jgi:hypothetical protein
VLAADESAPSLPGASPDGLDATTPKALALRVLALLVAL